MNDLPLRGLVIGRKYGSEDEGATHTYSKRIFVIGESELRRLVEERELNKKWGSCWRWNRYSAREDHGVVTDHRYVAGGLDLKKVLDRAGLSEEEKNGQLLFAATNYKAIVEHPTTARYYFDGNQPKKEAPAMLALESVRIAEDGKALSARKSGIYPRLIFGQRGASDINQCSFVRDLCRIQPTDLPPALAILSSSKPWGSFALADLIAIGCEKKIYTISGNSYQCTGIDLFSLLHRLKINGWNIGVKNSSGERLTLDSIKKERYMLAWHSEDCANGMPQTNNTDLKLYGDGVVIDDISALEFSPIETTIAIGKRPQYKKKPWQREEDISRASFYCAVEWNGGMLYYNFSAEELCENYNLCEQNYSYEDHGIFKTVVCRGILISEIISSLCGEDGNTLDIPDGWKMQYLENDGYHANTPTYIDSILDVRGQCRPVLTFEKKETFAAPDELHQNEKDFSQLAAPCVYRCAVSANEAAVKGLLGVVIRERASAIKLVGYTLKLLNADKNNAVIRTSRVKGVFEGMTVGVSAPHIARFTTLSPKSAAVYINANAEVNFRYTEEPFTELIINGSPKPIRVSDLSDEATVIPASLEEVTAMLASGEACEITENRRTSSKPIRNLYIDTRDIADHTTPFGYELYLLYRYEGWFITALLRRLGIAASHCTVKISPDGAPISELNNCFIAYSRSESKGVPYNTAVYKRRVKEYERPVLIDSSNGKIIASCVEKLYIEH
ncbi:MAG: hypothetical protein RRY12_05085 [Cloacibacillus sp.]